LRGISPKKSIFIMIPLISEHKLPYNIYEPITYYLGKSGFNSLKVEL
ncbi:hypothetical protein M153_13950002, partial [Pseudoloma neurophilia]